MRRTAWLLTGLTLTAAFASGAVAQEAVRGRVLDAVTARPVVGAIVSIGPDGAQRSTRTDEGGYFMFARVLPGRNSVLVRCLGYEPFREAIDVFVDTPAIAVSLRRLATLDTVRVRAAKQGLFGVVATARDLRPLPRAALQVVGVGGGRVPLDSTAHFFVPIKSVGTYVLRARAPGYEGLTVSVIVSPNEGVEVTMLLDSALQGANHRLEVAFGDFDERVKQRGLASAIVPRTELLQDAGGDLMRAILFSRSFAIKNLRFGRDACVFLDGVPKALPLTAIEPEDVEAVEVYGRRADRSLTLAKRWPPAMPCGSTGRPSTTQGDDVVKWVVVWLKH